MFEFFDSENKKGQLSPSNILELLHLEEIDNRLIGFLYDTVNDHMWHYMLFYPFHEH